MTEAQVILPNLSDLFFEVAWMDHIYYQFYIDLL